MSPVANGGALAFLSVAGWCVQYRMGIAVDRRFPLLRETMDQNGAPEAVTIEKSGTNRAAIQSIIAERETEKGK
jgi:hypothetical protein